MTYNYPHTIESGGGERLTFVRHVESEDGDYLEVENCVQPNGGPPMHIHYKQEESITVVKGKLATQKPGEEPKYYGPGETVSFAAGEPHKFWNAGSEPLFGKGYIKPANDIEYFLTQIYASTKANGGKRPSSFDAAYLTTKYKTEFEMLEIPPFVKKVIFPLILFFGKLQGKHRKFKDAPEAV